MGEQSGTSAQRIRIGLTGLAFAFLLVLLGSAISRSGDSPEQAETRAAAVDQNDVEPTEPLAELGVAPGSKETNSANAVEAPEVVENSTLAE